MQSMMQLIAEYQQEHPCCICILPAGLHMSINPPRFDPPLHKQTMSLIGIGSVNLFTCCLPPGRSLHLGMDPYPQRGVLSNLWQWGRKFDGERTLEEAMVRAAHALRDTSQILGFNASQMYMCVHALSYFGESRT
jgi:hypothetical protein